MSLQLLLARQAGVISRDQALRCGLTGAAVDHRLRTRRWRPLHPCVYLVHRRGLDDEGRARAALLWAGDGAVLSGAAAAWWYGLLTDAPGTLSVAAPVRRRPDRPGVAVGCRVPAAADRTHHRGLPVTALALTVLEAALELRGTEGARLLDRAAEGGVGWSELLAAHRRNPATAAGPLLAAADARSAAVAEVLLVRLLCRSGISGWYRLPAAPGRPAGVAFPTARVTVEAIGWAAAPTVTLAARGIEAVGRARTARDSATRVHARPGSWGADRRTLRFGRSELASQPQAVLDVIAAAVDGRDLRHPEGQIGPRTGGSR